MLCCPTKELLVFSPSVHECNGFERISNWIFVFVFGLEIVGHHHVQQRISSQFPPPLVGHGQRVCDQFQFDGRGRVDRRQLHGRRRGRRSRRTALQPSVFGRRWHFAGRPVVVDESQFASSPPSRPVAARAVPALGKFGRSCARPSPPPSAHPTATPAVRRGRRGRGHSGGRRGSRSDFGRRFHVATSESAADATPNGASLQPEQHHKRFEQTPERRCWADGTTAAVPTRRNSDVVGHLVAIAQTVEFQ